MRTLRLLAVALVAVYLLTGLAQVRPGERAPRGWWVGRTRERAGPYRLGVAARRAEVTYLAPPDEVKPEFAAVTRAQAGIRTREYEARQEAERKLRDARAEKFRSEQQA